MTLTSSPKEGEVGKFKVWVPAVVFIKYPSPATAVEDTEEDEDQAGGA